MIIESEGISVHAALDGLDALFRIEELRSMTRTLRRDVRIT